MECKKCDRGQRPGRWAGSNITVTREALIRAESPSPGTLLTVCNGCNGHVTPSEGDTQTNGSLYLNRLLVWVTSSLDTPSCDGRCPPRADH